MRLTWFEHAIYGLKARCHTTWLQTQIDILFSAFRLLFSFCFSHYFQSSCLSFFFLYVPDIYVGNISWRGGTWTRDILVNGQALYLLSYTSIFLYWQKPSLVNHIQPRLYAKWSIRESNPPPPACKTDVAPLRLMPHIRRQPSCRHI